MIGKEFFKLEAKDNTFVLELKANCHGFRRGDMLVCRKTSKPLPATAIAILGRHDCGMWPMVYSEAAPELAAGAALVGQALSVSRDLDREE